MSKVGDIIAGNSAVIHSNGPGHLWRQRQACPICTSDETPAKEPPPPAATEQVYDIADDLPLMERAVDFLVEISEPRRVYNPANDEDLHEITKLFGGGEMTDGD